MTNTGHVTKTVGQSKKSKTRFWSSVVTVLLIDGNNLLSMDDNGLSDPYVKFRLGSEKCKSKVKNCFHIVLIICCCRFI